MQVYIATEQRFLIHGKGYYAEALGGNEFWNRYLEVFSKVHIVARVTETDSLPESALRVDTDVVQVVPVPGYQGPLNAVLRIPQIISRLHLVADTKAAFILRVPGIIGTLLHRQLEKRNWPYAVEVVGDPHESLSMTALHSYSGYIIRPFMVAELKKQCENAVAAAYVTLEALQKRYPTSGYSVGCSDIVLTEEWFSPPVQRIVAQPELEEASNNSLCLIFIGSLAQQYKGLHLLLAALDQCKESGLDFRLKVLGDGQYRQDYQNQAATLGLEENVVFYGNLKHGQDVIRQLRDADLFVMPSLVEGLPRAMLEAMACGLPCIGSKVGGIPELLPAKDMFEPDNVNALADKIREVTQAPGRMKEMAERNYQTALQYRAETLHVKRHAFYQFVHDATMDRIGGES